MSLVMCRHSIESDLHHRRAVRCKMAVFATPRGGCDQGPTWHDGANSVIAGRARAPQQRIPQGLSSAFAVHWKVVPKYIAIHSLLNRSSSAEQSNRCLWPIDTQSGGNPLVEEYISLLRILKDLVCS